MTKLDVYEETMKEEWLDANGHLNEGYYLVAFSKAGWQFADRRDIGVDYLERTGCSFYTVESHLRYLNEVRAPAVLQMTVLTFAVDEKRWHGAQIMSVDGVECATLEYMCLHVDSNLGRTVPIPGDIRKRLEEPIVPELPSWSGRSIGGR